MDEIGEWILAVVLVIALLFAAGIITMLIVNYLFASSLLLAVFGAPAITFWKAFWLNVLCMGTISTCRSSK